MLSALKRLFRRTPTKDDFARKLLATLRARGAPEFAHNREQDCLERDGGTYQLSNAFLRYSQAEAADRPGLIDHFATSVIESLDPPPKLWEVARQRIVPLLRSATLLDLLRFNADSAFEPPPSLPFGERLAPLNIHFGIDNKASVAHVSQDLINTWAQPLDVVLSHALANLTRMAQWAWEEVSPGAFVLRANEYVESLPLLPRFVESLPFAEHTVLAIPCRGHVLACDGRDAARVVELCGAAEQRLMELPWPLTEHLLQHIDGTWQPHRPASPDAQRAVDRLSRIGQLGDYSAQQEAIEAALARRKEDVFVARYTLAEFDIDGHPTPRAYCVWPEDVDSLLPVTDAVVLAGESPALAGTHVAVRWRDLIELAGHHLEHCGYCPERYRARTYPSADEIAALARRAVDLGGPWPD